MSIVKAKPSINQKQVLAGMRKHTPPPTKVFAVKARLARAKAKVIWKNYEAEA